MKRKTSFLIIFIIYLLAFWIGFFTFKLMDSESFILKVIISDIVATVFVWVTSVIFKNSSIYDPYWSVAPMVIVLFFVSEINLNAILMVAVVWLWGIRLTLNWAYTFKGLDHQDWRYTYYKNKTKKAWQIVNLFGIHLMPTIVVISAMIPAFIYLQNDVGAFNPLVLIGFVIALIGIGLELFADLEMHKFKLKKTGETIKTGLWKYSRHPNYLGEITMWWGVYFMMLTISPSNYLLFICPLINTFLFLFISIPLMENKLIKNKPDYNEYKSKTSMLLLLPSKNK